MTEESENSRLTASDVVRQVTAIGSPIVVGTALLFYFGWARSYEQARAFGADVSVFELSSQDLMLSSINVLFFPAVFLLLAWLLAIRLAPWLRARSKRVAPVLRYSWVLLGVGFLLRAVTSTVGDVLLPFWAVVAILGTAYGHVLQRHARGDDRPPRTARVVLVVLLVTVALFWQTERLAKLAGHALAQETQRDIAGRLSRVSLISGEDLYIDGVGVEATRLSDEAFRYDGLYLLQRSGDKYFLLTDGWAAGEGKLILVTDTDSVSLRFGNS